jgi:hypothetical protein
VDGDLHAAETDSSDFPTDDFDPVFGCIVWHISGGLIAETPAAVEEAFPRAEDDFVGSEAD